MLNQFHKRCSHQGETFLISTNSSPLIIISRFLPSTPPLMRLDPRIYTRETRSQKPTKTDPGIQGHATFVVRGKLRALLNQHRPVQRADPGEKSAHSPTVRRRRDAPMRVSWDLLRKCMSVSRYCCAYRSNPRSLPARSYSAVGSDIVTA